MVIFVILGVFVVIVFIVSEILRILSIDIFLNLAVGRVRELVVWILLLVGRGLVVLHKQNSYPSTPCGDLSPRLIRGPRIGAFLHRVESGRIVSSSLDTPDASSPRRPVRLERALTRGEGNSRCHGPEGSRRPGNVWASVEAWAILWG